MSYRCCIFFWVAPDLDQEVLLLYCIFDLVVKLDVPHGAPLRLLSLTLLNRFSPCKYTNIPPLIPRAQ